MADEAHGEQKHEAASGGGHGGGHGGGGHGGGGHGGGHEEAHEGAPEWLISFADNVALLMGFFVILLAMNMGPKATPVQGGAPEEVDPAMEAIISIRKAFNTADFDPNNPEEAKILRYIRRKLGNAVEDGIPGSSPNVQAIRPSDFKEVTTAVPFDARSAVLSPAGRQSLSEVATKLRDQRWVIEVRGHVSPFEEMRDSLKGMDLSHARAKVVAQALVEEGLRWENLRLVACGSNDRVVGRTYDPQQDRSNQRVEVVVTNETVQPDYYAQPPANEQDRVEASVTPSATEPHEVNDHK